MTGTGAPWPSALEAELQRSLLFSMLRIRLTEERIADRYADQQMRCPVHLSIGQEGVAAGVGAALECADYAMSTHRAHAHYLAKGGDMGAMIAELYGKATGCAGGKGGSMHLIDRSVNMLGSTAIVSGTLPVAVGTAFGSWLRNEARVTLAFLGEAASEEGVFSESLNFAALKQLPVVFVCEDNLYSVYSPPEVRRPESRNLVTIAAGHGIPGVQGDGNDVEFVYRATKEAVERARRGEGPSFLLFKTYRWREHCGPNFDNHIGYRTEEEYLSWKARDPIDQYEAALRVANVITDAGVAAMHAQIAGEIDEAFAFALASPFPAVEELSTGVYASSAYALDSKQLEEVRA